jgi:ERCC4-related helicase
MPEETLTTITPRKYQQEIYNTCKDKNCLVVLPTGIGKTLIALMLTINRQKTHPGKKALFLAPTRPLAEQHLKYFQKHLPELWADMQLFTGKVDSSKRKKIWQTADIIFSTPQCISNDLKKNLYTLEDVSLLIEDECHRCLKNYAYTYVAEKYIEQSNYQRILGMTASPGTDKKTIKQIAENLNISAIELRTRNSDDVKEYIQELEYQTIKIEFPEAFKKISDLLKSIYLRKVNELKNRKILFGPANKFTLLKTQKNIMHSISMGTRNFNMLAGASACAQAIKLQHALELLETQTLYSFHEYIQEIFEQARQKKSKAVQQLIKQTEFNAAYVLLQELLAKKVEHPKLLELKDLVEQQIQSNPKTKVLIFGQYRSTVTRICRELNTIKGIHAKVFVGQAKKTTKSGETLGLNQKEQAQIIEQFKSGEINALCSTSIGEEGLDIPEVNRVIFYEPIPSAIRSIQRRGRTARLEKGELIILITKDTRDEAYYYAAFHKEKRMHKAIQSMKNDLDNKSNNNQNTNTNLKKPQKTLF